MRFSRLSGYLGWLAGLAALLLWCVQVPAQSEVPDTETCLDCHEDYDITLAAGPHEVDVGVRSGSGKVSCGSCHSGGAVHAEDPSADNIGNPAQRTGRDVGTVCSQCHQPHFEIGVAGLDPHAGLDVSCADCHQIHDQPTGLLVDQASGLCGKCHVGIAREFQRRSNHPIGDGIVSCFSCHDLTGSREPGFGHGNNANCFNCHPEQSGPYLYEHEAGSSFGPEGDGCTACHSPHGGPNERLLHQPGDRLCRQCHGEPPLHRTQHGGIAASFGCLDCHSEVHGSYDNSHLLDPMLGSKLGSGPGTCFCHNVSD